MYAETLARFLGAMLAAHEARHVSEPDHGWEACPLTPSIHAVADAFDVLAADPHDIRGAALALHDRSACPHGCPSAVEDPSRLAATNHARRTQAKAAGAIAKFYRATS